MKLQRITDEAPALTRREALKLRHERGRTYKTERRAARARKLAERCLWLANGAMRKAEV